MERCTWVFHFVLTILNVILGLSAFITFWVLENPYATVWAFFTALFASIVLKLHVLYLKVKLENYYNAHSLLRLGDLGVFVGGISSGFCIYYLFYTFYVHVPMYPISHNTIIPAVWAFMTAKWGFLLRYWSLKYRVELLYGFGPLVASTASTATA